MGVKSAVGLLAKLLDLHRNVLGEHFPAEKQGGQSLTVSLHNKYSHEKTKLAETTAAQVF